MVECAWTLRYLTQKAESIEGRTWKYINFVILDKQFWMYHALATFKDEELKADIRAHGKELDLHDDPTEVEGHWSGQKGFAWFINQGEHPLDGPNETELSKATDYAVDYHQTSSYVHCYALAVENFVPDEAKPFRVKLADGQGGEPGQSVLYILVRYLHACAAYTLFGMGLERLQRLTNFSVR